MNHKAVAKRISQAQRTVLLAHLDAIAIIGKPVRPTTRFAQITGSLVVNGLLSMGKDYCTLLTDDGRGVLAALLAHFADLAVPHDEANHPGFNKYMGDRFFGPEETLHLPPR